MWLVKDPRPVTPARWLLRLLVMGVIGALVFFIVREFWRGHRAFRVLVPRGAGEVSRMITGSFEVRSYTVPLPYDHVTAFYRSKLRISGPASASFTSRGGPFGMERTGTAPLNGSGPAAQAFLLSVERETAWVWVFSNGVNRTDVIVGARPQQNSGRTFAPVSIPRFPATSEQGGGGFGDLQLTTYVIQTNLTVALEYFVSQLGPNSPLPANASFIPGWTNLLFHGTHGRLTLTAREGATTNETRLAIVSVPRGN